MFTLLINNEINYLNLNGVFNVFASCLVLRSICKLGRPKKGIYFTGFKSYPYLLQILVFSLVLYYLTTITDRSHKLLLETMLKFNRLATKILAQLHASDQLGPLK